MGSSCDRRAEVEGLLRPVLGMLYGTALRMCGNDADAKDLVQEAALLVFRHFESFTAGTNFRAWACKILTNCYRARYRRASSRRATVAIDDVKELQLYICAKEAGLIASQQDAATALIGQMDLAEVTGAIDALPEEYRLVAILYFTQELSYQEIADVVDCPVGTVRSRLHRARKTLQNALRQIAEERGIFKSLGGSVVAT